MRTICFLAGDWGNATAYVRLQLPAKILRQAGWSCFFADDYEITDRIIGKVFLPNNGIGIIKNADIIVTQGWMNRGADQAIRQAQANGQKVFADIDDHSWAAPTDNPGYLDSNPLGNPEANRYHYWDQLKVCDGIICSTPTLVEFLGRLCVPLYLRRNMIDLDLWERRDVTASGWRPRIGWTGCTRWRPRDLTLTQGCVGEFVNDHDLEFFHVGHRADSPSIEELLGIENGLVERTPQVRFDEFPAAVAAARIDVGIVPLEYTEFNKAKSALKGMEYAASGIPFIASALPEYRWLGTGLLAETKKGWKEALERLRDPDFRSEIARQAYERVKREDYRVRAAEYIDLFEEFMR